MKHASLFSGIGGPEVAAAILGWDNVFHCEINPFGRAILDYWFPNSDSYEDITKTDFTKYRGRVDVLTGGFPCQPFSYAGKRGGQSDERYLWPEMLRVIDEVRPTWVVGENVAGITTMVESCETTDMGGEASLFEENNGVHRFGSEFTFTIERICRDLESKGYSVQPMLIPACAVGAPHRRDRVFIIAHASSSGNPAQAESGRAEGSRSNGDVQPEQRRFKTERTDGLSAFPRFTPDSNDNSDVREPGKHAGQSREKRISERNEVQLTGESGDVRFEVQGIVGNTERLRLQHDMVGGCQGGMLEEAGGGREDSISEQIQFSETASKGRASADSDRRRRREMDEYLQPELTDGTELISDGGVGDVAYAFSEGLERQDESRGSEGGERMYLRRDFAGCCGANGEGLRPEERWRNFPTVSPVHRGNDGFPFDVDHLTISFAKWRNESLKAYGNAIVPQVMYRIFQCIEQITLF